MSNPKITDENQISEILELYNAKTPISKIAKKYNVYHHNVVTILKRYKDYSPSSISLKNINYFSNIDTQIKAYLLGFIAADGALVNEELTITIHNKDRIILDVIKYELESTNDIQVIRHNDVDHVRFTTKNTQIYQDIIKYGILPNKSLSMTNIIENIPKEFRYSFILGYFDGDGSINVREVFYDKNYTRKQQIQIRATKEFALGIVKELDIKTFNISEGSIPSLVISSLPEIEKFYNLVYSKSPIYLSRKKDKFMIALYRQINKSLYRELYNKHISQGQTISSSY